MKLKGKAVVWVFILLAGIALRVFAEQYIIQTDVASGIFPGDQRLAFSIEEPGWLRLVINDSEVYWGRGPLVHELAVPWGEEGIFFITAEYYSQDHLLVESRSWYIVIDKRHFPFPEMEFRHTTEGLRVIVSGAVADGIMIRALAETEEGQVFFPDLASAEALPADSFQAEVWAEDSAGNSSERHNMFFELPPLRIENPVPGEWLNRQTLIISGAEGMNVYWTADGSDPLAPGGTGRLYRGPVRLHRDGSVTLRVAWRDSNGAAREERVEYEVISSGGPSADLSAFFMAEETEIRSALTLSVPPYWYWSMGDIPRRQVGRGVTLRPGRLARRTVALQLAAPGEGGIYRFAYLLNGTIGGGFPVSPELPAEEKRRGRIAYRNYGSGSGWNFASGLLEFSPGMVAGGLAVCDGEDIEWAFISVAAAILERAREDRLAPEAPVLANVHEGGWARGPVTVNVISDEDDAYSFISARLHYASGLVEIKGGTGSLVIASSLGEAAEVSVESYLVDSFGNRGPSTVVRFIIDPKTIYVSPEPLISSAMDGQPSALGGKDNPFTSLREALDYAIRNNIVDVLVTGTHELREPVTVSGTVRIDGGWWQGSANATATDADSDNDNRAVLVLGDGFFWDIRGDAASSGAASLTLAGLIKKRGNGDSPLIRAGINSRLNIEDSDITHKGPFLIMANGGVGEIRNSRIFTRISGDRRIAAFSALESDIQITGSHIQLDGNFGLVFNLGGGYFFAGDSVFSSAGRSTATVFLLNRTRGRFENLRLSASAPDYASVIEAFGAGLILNGGTLEVAARDTSALLFDNSAARLDGVQVTVEGAFMTRAMEIRGLFPVINNSRFFSTGSSGMSEVFSGIGRLEVPHGSITGNYFSGFRYVMRGQPAW